MSSQGKFKKIDSLSTERPSIELFKEICYRFKLPEKRPNATTRPSKDDSETSEIP